MLSGFLWPFAQTMSYFGYDFATCRVQVRPGIWMNCIDSGPRDGPVIVMLHGTPTWSYMWRHVISALNKRYRCIVPDHIGMGLSDKPSARDYDYVLQSRADDLGALLQHLKIDGPLTLAVHDWGAMIGFAWALNHHAQVERLIITNSAAFPLPPEKPVPWQIAALRNWKLGHWLVRGLNLFAIGATRLAVSRPMPGQVRKAYVAPYNNWNNRIGVFSFMQDVPLSDADRSWPLMQQIAHALPSFSCPTFIAWGLRDLCFDHLFLQRFVQSLPQAEVMAFEDANHYVLEDKHEVIVPAIEKFLAKT